MNDFNDYELLYLIKEDNEEALKILYEKYDKLIWQIIHKYESLIKLFKADEEDVYCIALINFNYAIEKYNDNKDANFKTYLGVVIKRAVLKYIFRNNKNKIKEDYILDLGSSFDIIDEHLEPSKELEIKEILDWFNKCEIFSSKEKDILKYIIEGYNYQDIIKILNINSKQLYNTLGRIRKKIKENT